MTTKLTLKDITIFKVEQDFKKLSQLIFFIQDEDIFLATRC